jgi:phage tail-like protein
MLDLRTGFYFSLVISGSNNSDVGFQEVSGLTVEIGVEEVVSGGENRFKYRLPGITTYSNLVLKRGIASEASPLIKWCQLTLDSGLAKPIGVKDISLNLFDEKGNICMSWHFVKAYPIKLSVSDLKSQESSLLIETIELAYQYFTVNDGRNK